MKDFEMKFDTGLDLAVESKNGLYIAHLLPGRMEGWGLGDINRVPNVAEEDLLQFAQAVVDSIELVAEEELAYSDCTDGRRRTELLDGNPVPNREKLVGADIITGFHMAEALGNRFYKDPDAPLEERLDEVITHFMTNNVRILKPSTHLVCKAAEAYPTISQNTVSLASVPGYAYRQRQLLPKDVYDPQLHARTTEATRLRHERKKYEGWSDGAVQHKIKSRVGSHAISQVRDDGRGVHGHVEGMIVRQDTPSASVNVNTLAQLTNGGQAFIINDNRIHMLAETFGRGHDEDYQIAYMAGEDITDAGHGTLATNLPTLVVKAAA